MSRNKRIKTRDPLVVRLINGATKGGVHKDQKKEQDKFAAREKVGPLCRQCFLPLDESSESAFGFCSDFCRDNFHCDLSDEE